MITALSRKIADFLVRENTIEKKYLEVYMYGIELWLSSIISVLLLLFITIPLHRITEGIIFYIVFCITRLFCGGYHAKNYTGCKTVFSITLLTVLFLNEMLREIHLNLWFILWCYYAGIMFCFAPIDNENKKLEEKEKKKYKIISIVLSFFWLFIEVLLYETQSKFMRIIPITLAIIATLLLLEINKNILKRKREK